GGYKEPWPTWPRSGTQHGPEHSEKTRHRAISGTGAEDDVGRVPAKTLGTDRDERLLPQGCVRVFPFGLIGRPLLYETVDSQRGPYEDRTRNGRTGDDSGVSAR